MQQIDNHNNQDDLGPKIVCFSCAKEFYYFQYNDHLQVCLKNHPLYKDNNPNQKDLQSHIKQEKVSLIKQDVPSNSKKSVIKQEREEKQQKKQMIEGKEEEQILPNQKEDNWLKKFEIHKSKISRIADKKSKVQRKEREQRRQLKIQQEKRDLDDSFSELPCPFCGKTLQLDQMEHIDTCQSSVQCKFCHDKYPKALISSHHKVCNKNNQRNSKINPNHSSIKKSQIEHPPMRFANERPKEQVYHRPSRPVVIPPEPQEQFLDPRAFDQASMLSKKSHQGMTDKQLNSLDWEIFVPPEGDEQETECAICANEVSVAQEVIVLRCKHLFHKQCLLPWLKQRSSCPNCKKQILS